jgi:hypothetical protein
VKELMRTNDPVLLSYVQALLKDARIEIEIFDLHFSFLEGSIGILPRRVMVADEDLTEARQILDAAEIPYEAR